MSAIQESIEIENGGVARYVNADDISLSSATKALLKCFSNGATVLSVTSVETDYRDIGLIESRRKERSEPLTDVLNELDLGKG